MKSIVKYGYIYCYLSIRVFLFSIKDLDSHYEVLYRGKYRDILNGPVSNNGNYQSKIFNHKLHRSQRNSIKQYHCQLL